MLRGALSLSGRAGVGASAACIAFASVISLAGCGTMGRSTSPPVNANASKPTAAVLGYVWDSRVSGLRPVTGVLGAAHLENSTLGSTFAAATPCVGKNFALLADPAGVVLMMSLPAGQPIQLAGSIAKNERLLLSPSCSYGLVYAPGNPAALLISGLPASPLVQSLSLSSAVSIVGAVVSDKGSVLLAGLNSDGSASVQLIPISGPPQSIKRLSSFGAMAFSPGGDAAVLADSAVNTVWLATQLSGSPAVAQLASSSDGVSKPLAASVSADGHFAFVANGSGGTILRFDLSSGSGPMSISCACAPSELIPLFGNAGFQLTDPAAGTIFALEGDSRMPRTLFIPTDKVGAVSGGTQ